jgi:hypothetical protein
MQLCGFSPEKESVILLSIGPLIQHGVQIPQLRTRLYIPTERMLRKPDRTI